jgi:fucose 4-O-acetylase-like acetyltransferase
MMLLAIKNTQKNRDQFLDIAKGIAIILVILGHTFQGFGENFDDLVGFRSFTPSTCYYLFLYRAWFLQL